MKQLPLGKTGRFTIVDDEDYERCSAIVWSFAARRYAHNSSAGYLHRLVISAKPGETVDHINGDGLDNRRSNLRICTQSENLMNRRALGISFHKAAGKWTASIKIRGKKHHLGCFVSRDDALAARRNAEELHFREFRWGGAA